MGRLGYSNHAQTAQKIETQILPFKSVAQPDYAAIPFGPVLRCSLDASKADGCLSRHTRRILHDVGRELRDFFAQEQKYSASSLS
jgi:hypothetical protein